MNYGIVCCCENVFCNSLYAMKPLSAILRERQLRYLGHALRLQEGEPAKTFALYDPAHGRRKQGRPKLAYTKYVASLIADDPAGCTRAEIEQLAQNRTNWRRIVAGVGAY